MRTKVFNWMLMAAVVLGLGMSVSSCKDDEEIPVVRPDKTEQEQAEKAAAFWNIVGKLVSVDDVTDDYQGKTFEPTIGLPDGTNETTRIVNTNDMKTAAQRFANLVDAKNIDENTQTYEWSDPEIGTMIYTKGGDPANWATVDVDIKAVPTLQKIIYREGGEGDNGFFPGRAYYRFGDVVKRRVTITYDAKENNDDRGTIDEYWICVRPAFGPEKKQDSHWVCVNTVSDKNYDYYHSKTNGKDYWLPYNLKTDKENMQNFAELIWAIVRPNNWFTNVFTHHVDGTLWGYDGLAFFTDFQVKNLKYHNQFFWQNVQKAWTDKKVAETALATENLDSLRNRTERYGVHLLYYGHKWWQTTSWNCQLWEAVYTNGTKYEELNLHHAQYNEKIEHNMKDITFDVREMGKDTENYMGFFNNDGKRRWVIRHATGKELSTNKKFNEKEPIQGVTEIYRYYSQYPDEWTKPTEGNTPEVSEELKPAKLENPEVGCFIGKDGAYYGTKSAADSKGGGAVAMVVYYNKNERVDSRMGYHGLAMALEDAGKAEWGHSANAGEYCLPEEGRVNNREGIQGALNGIVSTQWLAQGSCGKGNHLAAQMCQTMESINKPGFSNWFLPAIGHWVKAFTAMGMTWNGTAFTKGAQTSAQILSNYLKDDGCKPLDGYYWSSTEYGVGNAWCVTARANLDPYEIDYKSKTYDWKIRPFIAFDNSGQAAVDYGVDKAQAKVGYILASNGKFYKNQADVMASGQTGAAIVVHLGNTAEDDTQYTGLALALKPTEDGYAWGGGSHQCYSEKAACYMGDETLLQNGLAITNKLSADKCPYCGETHPIFQATKNFQPKVNAAGFSPWFVPSTGQWIYMLKSFGIYTKYETEQYVEEVGVEPFLISSARVLYIWSSYENFNKIRDAFIAAGATWGGSAYWCANYFDYPGHYDRAFTFRMDNNWPNGDGNNESHSRFGIAHFGGTRDRKLPLRPMIAF